MTGQVAKDSIHLSSRLALASDDPALADAVQQVLRQNPGQSPLCCGFRKSASI